MRAILMNARVKDALLPQDYSAFLKQLKAKIKKAQVKAALSVNSELIQLYWDIGKDIAEKQENEGWKTQTIEKIGKVFKKHFPVFKGFLEQIYLKCELFILSMKKSHKL